MKRESLVFEYLLCALNDKGRLPAISTEKEVCFFAANLIELIQTGAVILEKKKLICTEQPLSTAAYLEPMLNTLRQSKPKKPEDFVGDLAFSLSGKPMKAMMEACLKAMEADGLMETTTHQGLLKETEYRVCRREEKDRVVQKIRAEFLETGEISDDTMILGALLNKAELLKTYFSAYEAKVFKQRLKELSETPENKMISEMIDYVDTLIAVIAASA